jgi:hypothetical protein
VGETDKAGTAKVSMSKAATATTATRPARPGRASRPQLPKIDAPRTIDFARAALLVVVVGLWLRWLGLLGHDSTLIAWATKVNRNASKPVKDFDPVGYVHSIRVSAVVIAVVLSIAIALLIGVMRSTRSASTSRWGLLIVLVLTQIPLWVIPTSGWPVFAAASSVLAGVASIAALIAVFLPPSAAYFRACREASVPPELRGQPRPGLGSLLRPRPPGGARPGGGTAATRPARGAVAAPTRPSNSRAKAKVRADAEAVAKGAELARTRAKSGKTRRPE